MRRTGNVLMKENVLKNLLLILLLVLAYVPINNHLINSGLAADKAKVGNLLVAVSIIAVIACFGNFAFSYEKVDSESIWARMLGHAVTGLLMAVVGISLIYTRVLVISLIGEFIITDFMLVALYLACVGYDMLDVLKTEKR